MDCNIQLHLQAYHTAPGYKNEVPGAGILCENSNRFIGVGDYSNSNGKNSRYAIIGKHFFEWDSGVKIGGMAGIVDGYKDNQVTPMAAMTLTYKNMHFIAIPPVQNLTPLTIQFSITFPK